MKGRFVMQVLWGALFVVSVWSLRGHFQDGKSFHALMAPLRQVENQPAGEVVSGFYLKQPIRWDVFDTAVLDRESANEVCVSCLLANYGNRLNAGTFALALVADTDRYRIVIDAKAVRDNSYQRFCFPKAHLQDLVNRRTGLVLEGIDSRPGEAITAWMTKDTLHGEALSGEGRGLERSLSFRLETAQSRYRRILSDVVLAAICYLSGAVLFWALPGPQREATDTNDSARGNA